MSERVLDPFSAACGAVGPLLFEVEGPAGEIGPCRSFDQPFLVLGRGESADLSVVDEAVSRRHCYLQLIEGRLFGFDLERRIGTRFGGQPRPMGWVRPGETIGIGPFEVRFRGGGAWPADSEDPPYPILDRPADPGVYPGATLEITGQGLEPLLCRLSRVLTLVGVAPHCKVRLHDPRISRYHCALLRTSSGIWMIDLLSREGTLHNGAPRRVARIDDGDRLRIGLFTIRLRYDFSPNPLKSLTNGRAAPLPPASPVEGPVPVLLPGGDGSQSSPEVLVPYLPGLLDRPPSFAPDGPGADLVLRPIIEHLALMQQQMAEQFHQSVMLMAQMFGSMQRDQVRLVRGELEEIRKLTDEMHALREELKQVEPAPGPSPMAPGRREWPPRPRATFAPAERIANHSPPPRSRDDGRAAAPREGRPRLGEGAATTSDVPPGPLAPDRHIRRDAREVQVRIHELLARYESERQGRWGRVIAFLTGRPASS